MLAALNIIITKVSRPAFRVALPHAAYADELWLCCPTPLMLMNCGRAAARRLCRRPSGAPPHAAYAGKLRSHFAPACAALLRSSTLWFAPACAAPPRSSALWFAPAPPQPRRPILLTFRGSCFPQLDCRGGNFLRFGNVFPRVSGVTIHAAPETP